MTSFYYLAFRRPFSTHAICQSDGEVTVMLELWGIQRTSSLQSLPGPLWLGVVASVRALSTGLIELNFILMLN